MKKTLKQLICALAVLCIIAGLVPVQAQAYEKKGDYRIHTLSQKKWVTTPESEDDYYDVYKINVPSDGYIKVMVNVDKVTSRRPSRSTASLFTSYKVGADNAFDDYFIAGFAEGSHYLAIKKGTYYFSASTGRLKFKWELRTKSHGSNYCLSNAKTVTSGKEYRACFAYGYEFPKWYKIKRSKKQKIKVYVDRMECKTKYGKVDGPGYSFMIVNNKGIPVSVTNIDSHTQLTGLLAKGTYYICLQRKIAKDKDEYYGDRLIALTVKKQ